MITGMKRNRRSMIDFNNSILIASYVLFLITFCYSLGHFENMHFSTLKTRLMRNDGLVVAKHGELLSLNVRS